MSLKGEFPELKGFFTTTEFAKIAGVGRTTALRWAWEGKIEAQEKAGILFIPESELSKLPKLEFLRKKYRGQEG